MQTTSGKPAAQDAQDAKRNLYAGICFLALAVVLLARSLTLANPGFDPLGPAFMPRLALVVVGISAAILLAQGAFALRRQATQARDSPSEPQASTGIAPVAIVRSIGAIVLLAAYIELLVLEVASFEVITPFYVFATGALLGPRTPRALAVLGVIAVVVSLAVGYVFKTQLYVNLP